MVIEDKVKCSICNVNHKESRIEGCDHMFCNDCIKKNLDSRQRQCPLDRNKFDKNKVFRLIWGGNEADI